jgi:hypothetical protein
MSGELAALLSNQPSVPSRPPPTQPRRDPLLHPCRLLLNSSSKQTVDTGSGLLSMPCITPRVSSNCKYIGRMYNLTSTNQLSYAACAALYNSTIGGPSSTCYVNASQSSPAVPPGCYFSYGVRTDHTFSMYAYHR